MKNIEQVFDELNCYLEEPENGEPSYLVKLKNEKDIVEAATAVLKLLAKIENDKIKSEDDKIYNANIYFIVEDKLHYVYVFIQDYPEFEYKGKKEITGDSIKQVIDILHKAYPNIEEKKHYKLDDQYVKNIISNTKHTQYQYKEKIHKKNPLLELDIHTFQEDGQTLLSYAISKKSVKVVKELIQSGIDININNFSNFKNPSELVAKKYFNENDDIEFEILNCLLESRSHFSEKKYLDKILKFCLDNYDDEKNSLKDNFNLLNYASSRLSGMDVSEIIFNNKDIHKLIAHINKYGGETIRNGERLDLLGWDPKIYLPLYIRSCLQLYLKLNLGNEIIDKNEKKHAIDFLKEELIIAAESNALYREIESTYRFSKNYKYIDKEKLYRTLAKKVKEKLKLFGLGSEYILPVGWDKHSLSICLKKMEDENIEIRIDNLGGGREEYHLFDGSFLKFINDEEIDFNKELDNILKEKPELIDGNVYFIGSNKKLYYIFVENKHIVTDINFREVIEKNKDDKKYVKSGVNVTIEYLAKQYNSNHNKIYKLNPKDIKIIKENTNNSANSFYYSKVLGYVKADNISEDYLINIFNATLEKSDTKPLCDYFREIEDIIEKNKENKNIKKYIQSIFYVKPKKVEEKKDKKNEPNIFDVLYKYPGLDSTSNFDKKYGYFEGQALGNCVVENHLLGVKIRAKNTILFDLIKRELKNLTVQTPFSTEKLDQNNKENFFKMENKELSFPKILKNKYKEKINELSINNIFIDIDFEIQQNFVDFNFIENDIKKELKNEYKPDKIRQEDISFYLKNIIKKELIIIGEPGIGKTTALLKMANEHEDFFITKFYIPLKNLTKQRYKNINIINKNNIDILIDMINIEIFNNKLEGWFLEQLNEIIQSKKVLWLLDAFDEKPKDIPDFINKLIEELREGKYGTVITTSRPGFINIDKKDFFIEVKPNSKFDYKKYLKILFKESSGIADSIEKSVNENAELEKFLGNPLFFKFICLLGKENLLSENIKTRSGVYEAIVKMQIKNFLNKENYKISEMDDDTIYRRCVTELKYSEQKGFLYFLNQIHQVGYQNLYENINKSFKRDKKLFQAMSKIGFFDKISDEQKIENLIFWNPSLQNFFSAKYFLKMLEKKLENEKEKYDISNFINQYKNKKEFEEILCFLIDLIKSKNDEELSNLFWCSIFKEPDNFSVSDHIRLLVICLNEGYLTSMDIQDILLMLSKNSNSFYKKIFSDTVELLKKDARSNPLTFSILPVLDIILKIMDEKNENIIEFKLHLMEYLRINGDFQKAKIHADNILLNLKNYPENNKEFLSNAFINIALVYRDNKDINQSVKWLEKSRKILETPRVLNDLGNVYRRLGKKEEAEKILLLCVEKNEQNRFYLLDPLNQLGILYQENFKDLKKAEECFLKAIEIGDKYKNDDGSRHSKVAFVLNNLSKFYLKSNKLIESKQYAIDAYHIREKINSKSHEFATSCYTLGLVLFEQKEYEEAKTYFEQAYIIKKKYFGEKDKETQNAKERSYACGLILAEEKENILYQIDYLIKLGHIYSTKGQYTRAMALYCSALNRSNKLNKKDIDSKKAEITEKIEITEKDFLKAINAEVKNTPSKEIIDYEKILFELRSDCEDELKIIDEEYNINQIKDEKEKQSIEIKRAENVRKIQEKIQETMRNLLASMITAAIKQIGEPPCKYTIIGFGSFAECRITPYSDLEFGILIEEEKEEYKEYFRYLTELTHLKVILLGETVLYPMKIISLTENYIDNFSKNGLKFDSFRYGGCKTPLGSQKEDGTIEFELIHTPEEMAMFQKLGNESLEKQHLPISLFSAHYIMGDEKLLIDYQKEVNIVLTSGEVHIERGLTALKEDLSEFQINLISQHEEGKFYDVKREIYRLSDRMIAALCLYFGIYISNSWKKIDALESIIGKENTLHILVIFSIASEVRLRSYLSADEQKDNKWSAETLGLLFNKNSSFDLFFRYYYRALALQKNIKEFLLFSDKKLLSNSYFDDSLYHQAIIYKKLLKYEKSLECSLAYIEKNLNHSAGLLLTASLFYTLGQGDKAIVYYEKALELDKEVYGEKHPFIAITLNNLGTAWKRFGDITKAIDYFEQALAIMIIVYGNNHPDTKTIRKNLEITQLSLKESQKIEYSHLPYNYDNKASFFVTPFLLSSYYSLEKPVINQSLLLLNDLTSLNFKAYANNHEKYVIDAVLPNLSISELNIIQKQLKDYDIHYKISFSNFKTNRFILILPNINGDKNGKAIGIAHQKKKKNTTELTVKKHME